MDRFVDYDHDFYLEHMRKTIGNWRLPPAARANILAPIQFPAEVKK